jgi:hypothetical protein
MLVSDGEAPAAAVRELARFPEELVRGHTERGGTGHRRHHACDNQREWLWSVAESARCPHVSDRNQSKNQNKGQTGDGGVVGTYAAGSELNLLHGIERIINLTSKLH